MLYQSLMGNSVLFYLFNINNIIYLCHYNINNNVVAVVITTIVVVVVLYTRFLAIPVRQRPLASVHTHSPDRSTVDRAELLSLPGCFLPGQNRSCTGAL